MRTAAVALMVLAGAAGAEEVATPSGLAVEYLDRFVERQAHGEVWLTLRYLAPAIGAEAGDLGYEDVTADIDYLCDAHGLAAADEAGGVDQVLITLMDRRVERGVFDPAATVFIGAYLPQEGGCLWQ